MIKNFTTVINGKFSDFNFIALTLYLPYASNYNGFLMKSSKFVFLSIYYKKENITIFEIYFLLFK